MCFTEKRHYEAVAPPPRPVAPVTQGERYERPRKAPMVPPDRQTRKRTEAQVKKTLRDADKVQSNRQKRLFSTSNSAADDIRARTIARAKQAPPRPRAVNNSTTSSPYPAPLNIRKKPHLGGTTPALRIATRQDQSNIHPAFRNTVWPGAEVNTHPALRFGPRPDQSDIHPALRTRAPREPSIVSQSDIEMDILLGGNPYEISPLNVTQRLPYAHKR